MPTIVAKGGIILKLDDRYEAVEQRMYSLQRLRDTHLLASGIAGGLITFDEEKHLLDDWFSEPGFWNALTEDPDNPGTWNNGDVDQVILDDAKVAIQAGFLYALEISLGLDRGQAVPWDASTDRPKPGDIPEAVRKPVKVYWVCGKANGFDVQVVWNSQQVDLFIITPPIDGAADELGYPFEMADEPTYDRASEGMVLVTHKSGATKIQHVDLRDGGIVQGGTPRIGTGGAVRAVLPRSQFPADVRVDDCAGTLGRVDNNDEGPPSLARSLRVAILDRAPSEFPGLNAILVDISRVASAQSTLWATAVVQARHERVQGAPDAKFLGWRPTDKAVQFEVIVTADYEGTTITELSLCWDRLSVHGQLGVRAVGRPVLR
jgi:hypothetical protein